MAHVLLLEPNTLLAATYVQALRHAGWEVTHVTGAQAAIHEADVRPADVIIAELQLPRHNGIEFLHELRSYRDWQRVPVIVHTMLPPARLSAGREALHNDLGVITLLYKPATSLAELVRAVREQIMAAS